MKFLSKVKLFFSPTDDEDAVNKRYVDDVIRNIGYVGGSGSTYYGKIMFNKVNSSIDLIINGIDASRISTSTLLVLSCDESTTLETNFTKTVTINSSSTAFHIVDKKENPIRFIDIVNASTVLLGFNGTDFILLTKQYLIDSYNSSSITEGATAKVVKTVYDHFTDVIGDIPEVLDGINRKVV